MRTTVAIFGPRASGKSHFAAELASTLYKDAVLLEEHPYGTMQSDRLVRPQKWLFARWRYNDERIVGLDLDQEELLRGVVNVILCAGVDGPSKLHWLHGTRGGRVIRIDMSTAGLNRTFPIHIPVVKPGLSGIIDPGVAV